MTYPLAVLLATVLVAGAFLGGYDTYLYLRGGFEATISWHLYLASRQHPLLPCLIGLAVGILLGHFFWPQDATP